MRKTRGLLTALVLVAGLGLGACATDDSSDTATSAEGMEGVAATDSETMPSEVNDVDLHFLGMMVPHHEQAVEMSDIVLAAEGMSEQTRDLAVRIRDGQQVEIDQMNAWAEEWGQEHVMEHHAPHVANGMLTPGQMEQLRGLTGDDLETQFLELMYFHHQHVIAMTEDEIANGGYQPLRDMAQEMVDVQTAEMEEMDGLLGR